MFLILLFCEKGRDVPAKIQISNNAFDNFVDATANYFISAG